LAEKAEAATAKKKRDNIKAKKEAPNANDIKAKEAKKSKILKNEKLKYN
jgi:hypothetical protein